MKSEAAESFRHGSREESGQLYFVRRHKKYRSKRHVACSNVGNPNSIDASFQVCTQNQIEAQRSGWHFCKKMPEQSGLCSDVVETKRIELSTLRMRTVRSPS